MTMASSTTSTVAGAAYLQYFPQPIRWPSFAATEMPHDVRARADGRGAAADVRPDGQRPGQHRQVHAPAPPTASG